MDEHQNKIFGACKPSDLWLTMTKKEGDKIKIFVSEKDASKSCLVPDLEAFKNNWDLSTQSIYAA